MIPLTRIPLASDLKLPHGTEARVAVEPASHVWLLALAPGAASDGLPDPGRAEGSWLNIGPREWLCIGDEGEGKALVDMSDAFVVMTLSGGSIPDLLGSAMSLAFAGFGINHVARARFGEIAVVLHRYAPEEFRLLVPSPYAGYVVDWLRHHF